MRECFIHQTHSLWVVYSKTWSRPSKLAGDRTHEWGCARLFLTKFSATTPPSKMLLSIFVKNYSSIKKSPQAYHFFIFAEDFFFIDFNEIFGNFRVFWKSRFFANRYWSRVRLYIGIYRRSKKGSFSSILWGSTHLFWKKRRRWWSSLRLLQK